MLKRKVLDALNKQVNAELYSAYLYYSMEAYFQSLNLVGFANWMKCQTQEELLHASMIYNFINDRGGKVTLKAIEGPPTDWKSPLDVFKGVYEHEQKVTGMIDKLVNLAIAESDHATNNFLQWFVKEQVEEESSADAIIQKLNLIGKEGGGMFMLDRELAQRVFTMPSSPTGE